MEGGRGGEGWGEGGRREGREWGLPAQSTFQTELGSRKCVL